MSYKSWQGDILPIFDILGLRYPDFPVGSWNDAHYWVDRNGLLTSFYSLSNIWQDPFMLAQLLPWTISFNTMQQNLILAFL